MKIAFFKRHKVLLAVALLVSVIVIDVFGNYLAKVSLDDSDREKFITLDTQMKKVVRVLNNASDSNNAWIYKKNLCSGTFWRLANGLVLLHNFYIKISGIY